MPFHICTHPQTNLTVTFPFLFPIPCPFFILLSFCLLVDTRPWIALDFHFNLHGCSRTKEKEPTCLPFLTTSTRPPLPLSFLSVIRYERHRYRCSRSVFRACALETSDKKKIHQPCTLQPSLAQLWDPILRAASAAHGMFERVHMTAFDRLCKTC